jgi:RNA-binding protein YlmH
MAIDTEKELLLFQNRVRELANKSLSRNMFTFTDFLGVSEQDVFRRMEREIQFVNWKLWGGAEETDRAVIRFGTPEDLGYEEPFPIVGIHIQPKNEKFADELSHRDFLGALMHLGIDRGNLGDIRVGVKDAFLFCLEKTADFICTNLDKVRHTAVKCSIETEEFSFLKEEPVGEEILVSSERMDGVLAKVAGLSRAEVLKLFMAGKVYLNGRLSENPGKLLQKGDAVNARGFGKFIYDGLVRETKKGKLSVKILKYR